MKMSSVPVLCLGILFLISIAGPAAAQGKSVTVPKGTKAEKLGSGSFKLTAPDGTVFKITSFKKAAKTPSSPGSAGIIGDCGIHDAKGKLIASGTNGVLKGKAATASAVKGAPPGDYIKIDDEITWLPAMIEFPSLRVFDRQALTKLSPQPDPPGKK